MTLLDIIKSGLWLSLPVKIWPQVGCRRMILLTLQSSIYTDSRRVQGSARNTENFPNQMASLSYTTAKLRPSLMPFCILNQWQRVSVKPTLITLNVSQQEMRGPTQPLRQLPENLLQPCCCVSHLRFLPQRLSKAFATDEEKVRQARQTFLSAFFPKLRHGLDHQAEEAMLGCSHVWFRSDPCSTGTGETISVSQAVQPLPEK